MSIVDEASRSSGFRRTKLWEINIGGHANWE